MSVHLSLAGNGFIAVMAMMTGLWLMSLKLRDASIVDRFWGMAFVVLVWSYALAAGVQGVMADRPGWLGALVRGDATR